MIDINKLSFIYSSPSTLRRFIIKLKTIANNMNRYTFFYQHATAGRAANGG